MDSQNIHGIILQLKSITESIDKIAKGVNNSWRVWISLAGILNCNFSFFTGGFV